MNTYDTLCIGCWREKLCHEDMEYCEAILEAIKRDVRTPSPELVEAMKGKDLWIGNEAFAKCMEGE